jgi:retron-type reverse transcriptase
MSHVMELMDKYMRDEKGTAYCLKIDISKFYPNVNHRILKKLLRRKFKDKDLLELLDMIIDSFP